MNFLLSGYYGYGNAGDEAVLAAITAQIALLAPQSTFVVTSGDAAQTEQMHVERRDAAPEYTLRAIRRAHPTSLVRAIRACDVFVSGGGSLLQDATSVRNVIYYTSLMRFARWSRKPVLVYAHGVGPLHSPLSRKLARAAMQGARRITVRDNDSKRLLERIGVSKPIEVVADPVWNLTANSDSQRATNPKVPIWCVSMRSWIARESEFGAELVQVARAHGARLRFLPMQPAHDRALTETYFQAHADPAQDEIIETAGLHPRAILARALDCDLMIAMRLHALIFAASGRVPCVALNYDPKIEALSSIIGAPLLPDWNDRPALENAIQNARPVAADDLKVLYERARLPAQYTVELARRKR